MTTAAPGVRAGRSSVNYAISSETVAAAGGQASRSANYAVSAATVGEFAGASATLETSSNYLAKNGFVGQLYTVQGLAVAATPATINESGASTQLSAAPWLDDGTLLGALNPGNVAWAVVGGPVVSISPAGVATSATVYQNTAAHVQATALNVSGQGTFTVLNVNADDFGIYAGDGIDDVWQATYFGLNNPLAGPNVDADGTGQTNRFKYVAGLNPLDPAARFALTISAVSSQPPQRTLTFSPVYAGRTYTVQSSPDLSAPNWTALTDFSSSDSGSTRTVVDRTVPSGAPRFYRVLISFP